MLQRPAIDSCTTLPITGYYIHAIVTTTNGNVNEKVYTSSYIDDMFGGEFSVSYNDSFKQDLHPSANYIFVVNTQNDVSEISRTNLMPFCSEYLVCVYLATCVRMLLCIKYVNLCLIPMIAVRYTHHF